MKRLLPLLLCCLLLCPAAIAWDRQNTIQETELPAEAQGALQSGAYVTALWESPYLFLLTENADGTRVLTVYQSDSGAFAPVAASLPLSRVNGIQPSIIAAQDSVTILYSEALLYHFQPDYRGVWRLTAMQAERAYRCADFWVIEDTSGQHRRFAAATVSPELAVFQPEDFPTDFDAAARRMITDSYALVHNPDPADRLHLRTAPTTAAASLGKYYNGTPVQILQTADSWAHVAVAGVEGYMMTRYLAIGADMLTVEAAFPDLSPTPAYYGQALNVYTLPDSGSPVAGVLTDRGAGRVQITVIGIVGDDWLHVICASGLTGYMPAAVFAPGIG